MKIYLDMNDFASSGTVLSTLRSYDAINGNIEIFVKADGKVFTELDDFKKIRRRNKFDDDDLKYVNFFIKTLDDQDFRSLKSNNLLFRIHDDTILGCKKVYIFYNQNNNHWKLIAEIQEFPLNGEKRVLSKLSKSFERRPATNTMKNELKNFYQELKNMSNIEFNNKENSKFNKMDNITKINGNHYINVDAYNLCIIDN